MSNQKMSISIPWYSSEDDLKEILRLVPANESVKALPYREFVLYLEQLEHGVALGGQFPVRIEIKPDAIKAWCKDNKRDICRKAISEYAAFKMIKAINNQGN